MKTIIYLIRHSGPNIKTNILKTDNQFQITNEKYLLSIEAEEKAKRLSEFKELENIDIIFSSHYVRAVGTAKYISAKNNLQININSDFGERKVGIEKYEDMPDNYYNTQRDNPLYKVGDGENQLEVKERMFLAIENVLKEHNGKKIAIVSHSTAISFLLTKWCELINKQDYYLIEYQDKIILKEKMNSPEVFKLEFENNQLLNVSLITPEEIFL